MVRVSVVQRGNDTGEVRRGGKHMLAPRYSPRRTGTKACYINCSALIEQQRQGAFREQELAARLKHFAKYRVLIIDEIGCLPTDVNGANMFFRLIAKRYEKNSTIFTSNKMFSQWNEVFSDLTIASCITALSSASKASPTGSRSARSS